MIYAGAAAGIGEMTTKDITTELTDWIAKAKASEYPRSYHLEHISDTEVAIVADWEITHIYPPSPVWVVPCDAVKQISRINRFNRPSMSITFTMRDDTTYTLHPNEPIVVINGL